MKPVARKAGVSLFQSNTSEGAGAGTIEYDSIDGEILRDGDALVVQWPTGLVTKEACRILHTYESVRHVGPTGASAYVIVALGGGVVARVHLRQEGILCAKEGDACAPHVVSTAGAATKKTKPFSTKNLRLLAKYLASEEETSLMLLDAADEIDEARRAKKSRSEPKCRLCGNQDCNCSGYTG